MTYKQALKSAVRLLVGMLVSKRFRPEIATKAIENFLRKAESANIDVKRNRRELKTAEIWINNPPAKMSVDIIVFRLLRACPVTLFTSRYIPDALRRFEKTTTKRKKWRMIPLVDEISVEDNNRVLEHIKTLINHFESTSETTSSVKR